MKTYHKLPHFKVYFEVIIQPKYVNYIILRKNIEDDIYCNTYDKIRLQLKDIFLI